MKSLFWALPALVFTILQGNSAIGSPPRLNEGIGIHQLSETSTPKVVTAAAKSVLNLRVAYGLSLNSVKQFDVSSENGDVLKTKIRSMETSPSFDELDKRILINEIEHCERSQNKDLSAGTDRRFGLMLTSLNLF